MTRVIEFNEGEPKNQKRFELLYSAVVMGGNPQAGAARGGIEVLRREARLLQTLDIASEPSEAPGQPSFANGEPARLVKVGARIALDQPDFELLKRRLEETPWLPRVAREVVDAVDWLSATKAE